MQNVINERGKIRKEVHPLLEVHSLNLKCRFAACSWIYTITVNTGKVCAHCLECLLPSDRPHPQLKIKSLVWSKLFEFLYWGVSFCSAIWAGSAAVPHKVGRRLRVGAPRTGSCLQCHCLDKHSCLPAMCHHVFAAEGNLRAGPWASIVHF